MIDGLEPKNGWRSTWTAWYGVDPQLTLVLNGPGVSGQALLPTVTRDDKLKSVEVMANDDELNFYYLTTLSEIVGPVDQGKWVEFPPKELIRRQSDSPCNFRVGHQWGEVEFWVVDDGNSTDITGLSPNETYYYRTFASNDGGAYWAPNGPVAEDELAMKRVSCLSILLSTWEHSNGDSRTGSISQRIYYDDQKLYPSKYVLLYLISFILQETWKSLSQAMHL